MKNKFISFCLLLALPIALISCNTSKNEIIQSNPSPKEEVTSGLQEQPEEYILESNIARPYTKDQSIKNNDLVYDTQEEKYVDSTPLKNFLDNVKNNKPAKVRYTQYYEGLLDKMRDVEFDGKSFKLKEYDTKSPELKHYNYIVIRGESITVVSSYYKLDGDGIKLFPVESRNNFYGKWSISKSVASNSVTLLSNDDISKIIGQSIEFSPSYINYNNKKYLNVKYNNESISNTEFQSGFKGVSFNDLGIQSNIVNSISLESYDNMIEDDEVNGIQGLTLYKKSKNTIILYKGGVFFELHKQQ